MNRTFEAVKLAQEALSKWIVPDSGISDHDVLTELLGILDSRELVKAMRSPSAYDETSNPIPPDILQDLKDMSNKYIVCNTSYVIPKSVLDMYIEYLESNRLRELPPSSQEKAFPSWEDVIAGIYDSRFTTLEGKNRVREGARIMYDRLYIMLKASQEKATVESLNELYEKCDEPTIQGNEFYLRGFKDATDRKPPVSDSDKIIDNMNLKRKIEIHIETTEECMDNFNINETTKKLLEQDNELFREIIYAL